MLVRLSDKKLIGFTDDKRVLRFDLSPDVKYFRMQGKDNMERKEAGASDLKTGDHLIVESVLDDEGDLYVINVVSQKPGTEAEKQLIAGLDESMLQARLEPVAGGEPEPDDHPRIRRKDGSGAAPKQEAKPKPAAEPAAQAAAVPPPDADEQVIKGPTTTVVKADTANDKGDEEFGRAPKTKRGKPPVRASSSKETEESAVEVARAEPPPRAVEQAAASAREYKEDPSMLISKDENPVLTKARTEAVSFMETVPNYLCQQMTTRYISTKRSKDPDWQAQDIVSAEVIVEGGKERYRNLMLNNKPTKKSLDELGGARSTGEFVSVLQDLFSPNTAADFRYLHPETIVHRTAYMFAFKVDQPHSHWQIHAPSQSYKPAYKGSVWIDKETSRVLRIEIQATKLPQEFPFDAIETATDYDFVRIGTHEFILPVHAENLTCERATGFCMRNDLEFRNYRRFTAESEILPQ